MSDRADLFHRLVVDAGLSPHWADRQIDAFAHELAEQIRKYREPWEWALAGQHAGNDAADLIDPQPLSASSVRPDEEPTPSGSSQGTPRFSGVGNGFSGLL